MKCNNKQINSGLPWKSRKTYRWMEIRIRCSFKILQNTGHARLWSCSSTWPTCSPPSFPEREGVVLCTAVFQVCATHCPVVGMWSIWQMDRGYFTERLISFRESLLSWRSAEIIGIHCWHSGVLTFLFGDRVDAVESRTHKTSSGTASPAEKGSRFFEEGISIGNQGYCERWCLRFKTKIIAKNQLYLSRFLCRNERQQSRGTHAYQGGEV